MAMVGTALAYAIGQSNPLVAALWGVFVWKEFRGAPRRSQILVGAMFALYVGGLLLLTLSF
jgi:glucose uptake protein